MKNVNLADVIVKHGRHITEAIAADRQRQQEITAAISGLRQLLKIIG